MNNKEETYISLEDIEDIMDYDDETVASLTPEDIAEIHVYSSDGKLLRILGSDGEELTDT